MVYLHCISEVQNYQKKLTALYFLKLFNIYENYCVIILNPRNVSKHVNRVCRIVRIILHNNFLILDEHILKHVEPDEFRKHYKF